jgi:nitrate/nitrite transport system substrate-binding protein
MRRWGQIPEPKSDDWYHETAKSVYLPDVYREAAALLVEDGELTSVDVPATDGYRPPTDEFIDGVTYDGRSPNAYLREFAVGLKD